MSRCAPPCKPSPPADDYSDLTPTAVECPRPHAGKRQMGVRIPDVIPDRTAVNPLDVDPDDDQERITWVGLKRPDLVADSMRPTSEITAEHIAHYKAVEFYTSNCVQIARQARVAVQTLAARVAGGLVEGVLHRSEHDHLQPSGPGSLGNFNRHGISAGG